MCSSTNLKRNNKSKPCTPRVPHLYEFAFLSLLPARTIDNLRLLNALLVRSPPPPPISFGRISCIFRAASKKKSGFAFFVCEAKQTS